MVETGDAVCTMAHCIDSNGRRPQSMTRPRSSMLHPPVTISVAFVHGMLSGVRARGEPCDAFLADAGIDPELLEQAGARVTAEQYVALFQSLTDRLDDDLLGFLTRPLQARQLRAHRSLRSGRRQRSSRRCAAPRAPSGCCRAMWCWSWCARDRWPASRCASATRRWRGRSSLHELLLRVALASVRLAGRRQAARRAIRLRVPEPALRERLRQDLYRAAAVRAAAVGVLVRRRAAAATGAPRQGRSAGVSGRRAVQRHRAAARRRSGQRTRSQAPAAARNPRGRTSPPPPTRCTWRRPRCNGAWPPTALRSRR